MLGCVGACIMSQQTMLFQAETFNIPSDLLGIQLWRQQALQVGFASARYGSIMISSYPTGQIGFLLCEKITSDDFDDELLEKRFATIETTYYQPKLQRSTFDLPLWVEKAIYEDGGDDSKDGPKHSDEL